MTYQNVTIIGGGVLGAQIALVSALHGKNVTIWGRKNQSLDKARQRVTLYSQTATKFLKLSHQQLEQSSTNLHYLTDLETAVANADLVIECLPENRALKRDFFKRFAQIAPQKTVIATNTSTMLPSEFAEDTGRPTKFLAYHFANEIWKYNTAEIMPQSQTDPQLIDTFIAYSKEIGMVPLVIHKEQAGYLLNSMLIPFLQAALNLWGTDVANFQTIDKTWMIATGSAIGPFGYLDLIGIRTILAIGEADEQADLSQPVYTKIKNMLAAGHIGVETGQGFYTYPHPAYQQADFLK
ncbi:3-hydroxyacyl-CoA dehydrogenase [Fructilactobacillus florum]|uniref:3-hydroxybutyryl-CoA dehydrogenase n=1 Tax=Fructilactobacillus florum DSM 22689 = JCM 16035 TaxID=1423745 RepID=A0A0R2CP69_9LACO|nr:3-hydroxyacyl-CoA dehydrogenase [Fructilactobacillus florum]EKK21087.1 3-hydroxybutyryl-CoA dehydrogenase [Fructilactobacillus florum 2F]KRM90203.1 3-hydroxybutyryl-CoA dehydrogenase [Fructilactobacillus florum DSM 22689 = JCM 16035]